MRIGVAITTRNRPDVLKVCLSQFAKHRTDALFVVMDDNSKPDNEALVMAQPFPITYLYSKGQIGVARAKNQCLKKLQECDYVFLFDDDCFPIADGWAEYFINEHLRTGEHHFIYSLHGGIGGMIRVGKRINGLNIFPNGTGCFMFLTKKVIETLGGMNKEYGYWGHEHNGYSTRVKNWGLNSTPFITPDQADKYLWSLDLQGVPNWAKGIITGKFHSAEKEWWKKLQCKEYRTVKAYEYDCSHNYHQPL